MKKYLAIILFAQIAASSAAFSTEKLVSEMKNSSGVCFRTLESREKVNEFKDILETKLKIAQN